MSIFVINLFIHLTKMVLRGHASFVLSFMAMDKTSQNNLEDIINHVYHTFSALQLSTCITWAF